LNEYLNVLQESNALNRVEKILICVAVDTHFFEQIAKLRALRILISSLIEHYDIAIPVHIQAITSDVYRTPIDPYSNLLRDTIAGMAGILGGCNSLIIHRFDANIRMPNEFSDRLSRNQQLIFKEESHLQRIADVAHGAYFIESMTRQLAEQAWIAFQAIERVGGWLEACKKNIPQKTIHQQREELLARYKDGTKVLTGINKYQYTEESKEELNFPKAKENAAFPALNIARALLKNSEK
jgi:methylmalonyl-CoA mutase